MRIVFAGVLVFFIGLSVSVSMADSKSWIMGHLWKRHRAGVTGLINCWARGGSIRNCKHYLREILASEVDLIAYGVAPNNPRFVSSMAPEKGRLNLNEFAYQILLKKFEHQMGWVPSASTIKIPNSYH